MVGIVEVRVSVLLYLDRVGHGWDSGGKGKRVTVFGSWVTLMG